jgi:membrane-associated phospholipid phosphatase
MENMIGKAGDEECFSDASRHEGRWVQLAHIISQVMNPLFVALPTFLLVALHTAPDTLHALLWWAVIVVGISAVPFVFILRGVRRGDYTDQHLSIREQRLIPLLFGLGCTAVVFLCLLLLQASRPLIASMVAILFGGIITLTITRYWKISLHLVAMAGAVIVLGLVVGPLFYLLSPLVLLVGWARWQVRAHTPLQALAGTALAVGVTVAIFELFRIF